MKRASRGIAPFFIIVLVVVFLAVVVAGGNGSTEMTYSELMTRIASEEVDTITLSSDGGKAIVNIKNEKGQRIVNVPSLTAFMNSIEEEVKTGKVTVKEESPSPLLVMLDYITPISLVILFVLFWVFMMQSMNGGKGAMSFTKNRARLSDPDRKR